MLAVVAAAYAAGILYQRLARAPLAPIYPSPEAATREVADLAARHPGHCERHTIGHSTQGRPLLALRISGQPAADRPRLLITANIHAVEYIAGYMARAVAQRLLEGYGSRPDITALLDQAEVWIVPLLNPDGAERIWRARGFARLRQLRYTATGVDPNRNFPFMTTDPARGWNSASARPGSAYYRGPTPLSEPECAALADLCRRERFCAAINFHSFGGVVFMPAVIGGDQTHAQHALDVFKGVFQSRQPHIRYRPVPERSRKIQGQLDPFLLTAFGTPSVTIEISRLNWRVLKPWRAFNPFWIANPDDPGYWVANDADAAIHALGELLVRTGGRPGAPTNPELASIPHR